jgi:hypothetical protein
MWGPEAGSLTLLHELGPHHGDLSRRFDAEPHLSSFEPDDSHTDVVADEEFFHQLPRQHQHATLPLPSRGIGYCL